MIFNSCIRSGSNPDSQQVDNDTYTNMKMEFNNEIIPLDTAYISGDIDSIKIFCLGVGEFGTESSIFLLSDMYCEEIYYHTEKLKKTHSFEVKNKLINNINQFYIDKTEKIILKKKDEPEVVTEYPYIIVGGYREGKQIFNQQIKITYVVEFNPQFWEFYQYLESLVTSE